MKARPPYFVSSSSPCFSSFACSLGAAEAKRTRILFMIGEKEYRTDESLPKFAKEQLEPLGFESVFRPRRPRTTRIIFPAWNS